MPIVLATASGTSVGDIADRVYRDWLYAPEDQPIIVTLAADVDATTTTWTYNDDTLAPDEEEALAPGVIVEAGTEQARITAVDDTANSLTVVRGINGTSKESHTSGDEVVVAPTYGRRAVVDAVIENVVALYPSLWHVDTVEVTSDASPVEVPAEVITPRSLVWQNGTRWSEAPMPHLLENFPESSTGKAIQFYSVPVGRKVYFTYESKFARPDNEDSDVGELGVDRQWERIVAVGAAAQVVGQRPLDRLTAEYITEQLEREALPPGSPTDIRNGLLTLRSIFVEEEHRALRRQQGTAVVYNVTRLAR